MVVLKRSNAVIFHLGEISLFLYGARVLQEIKGEYFEILLLFVYYIMFQVIILNLRYGICVVIPGRGIVDGKLHCGHHWFDDLPFEYWKLIIHWSHLSRWFSYFELWKLE